jgi:hypothetical protein
MMSEAPPSARSRNSDAPPNSGEVLASGEILVLDDRFENLGRSLGARELEHAADIARARVQIERLHTAVSAALEDFERGARSAGAQHLEIEISEIRTDDKHLRAVEFELVRGRHCAIVTAKSRGEVTLVGPFRKGKNEGPCRSFPFDAAAELRDAVADFLEKFLEAAATP